MDRKSLKALDYIKILQEVAKLALTNKGKETILNLSPSINKRQIDRMLQETKEAVNILKISSSLPVHSLDGVMASIESAKKGLYMTPDQLGRAQSFFDHCRKLKRFMKDKEHAAPVVSSYALSITDLTHLEEELGRCIRNGRIDDHATKDLAVIRRQISQKEYDLKRKAEALCHSKKITPFLQETLVIEKNGRYTLPIKKQYRSQVAGTVVETSSSGATVFMEPDAAAVIHEELQMWKMSEEHEVETILYQLTAMILEKEPEILTAMETMHHYDVIFAKAKYCQTINGACPQINENGTVHIKNARHPLLNEEAVPLSLKLTDEDRALVITGPNTGGKTVTLKTVGLLTVMAQTGLLIPADEGSGIHLFHHVFVDIGDGQSIDENLSTFSSRMTNIIRILEETDYRSLVLLDELGSGTDPAEGMGLAQVIMEQLFNKGCTLLATTHYRELKNFADRKEGFVNGSMAFDLSTLQPTYQLMIGETGSSQAFDIALKLGMHPKLVEKAYEATYSRVMPHNKQTAQETENNRGSYEKQLYVRKYRRKSARKNRKLKVKHFNMGDNVKIASMEEMGIVYKGPDEKGNYVVQVKGEKISVNHKRLQLYISAENMYPADYDFDIIFKSKDYRKKKRLMDRKFVEGLTLDEEDS